MNRFNRIRVLRLAYECEVAVGQELDQLMAQGFRVFHDIQADGFNIDHLLVSESGVYAVETKGRSKSFDDANGGKKNFKVIYENGTLNFPGWRDTTTIPQARRQSQWASEWLSQAVGFSVAVRPIVVLPGWYIENKDRPKIPVIASGFIHRYFPSQRDRVLSASQVQQISYQVDQKVRDLPPGEIGRPLPEVD